MSQVNFINIALAQVNSKVGDLEGNKAKIIEFYNKAIAQGADIVIFSELVVTGYPPEDLVLRHNFKKEALGIITDIAKLTINKPSIIIGNINCSDEKLYNSAYVIENGLVKNIVNKMFLPNYGVFDEKRVFNSGSPSPIISIKGIKFGILICEDLWFEETAKRLKYSGASVLVAINASPFEIDKHGQRLDVARKNVANTKLPLIYVNQVGGQDEVVFEGGSFVMQKDGTLSIQMPFWQEDLLISKWTQDTHECQAGILNHEQGKYTSMYNAAKLGLHDYVLKNNFPGVVIGMSGGIDSALTAAIAVDALGADKVHLVMLPHIYTSKSSLEDAAACAKLLGCKYDIIKISDAVNSINLALSELFKGLPLDITEENIQPRVRANILMAISNKLGYMLLTTGNKSEMAVGYATLYGDMCGGFNILKDIYKTDVYALSHWRNAISKVIPDNIITKKPSAELKPDQCDQDTLPAYEILDDVLHQLIELKKSSDEIISSGHDKNTVKQVARMLLFSEYKRRQAPPGIKMTSLSFGKERRYPITNGYKI